MNIELLTNLSKRVSQNHCYFALYSQRQGDINFNERIKDRHGEVAGDIEFFVWKGMLEGEDFGDLVCENLDGGSFGGL